LHHAQTIDTVSQDQLIEGGYSAQAKEKAQNLVKSFEEFIRENKDEITAQLSARATGSTFEAISGTDLRCDAVAVAPLSEQRRIVAEIEKQFTRREAAVAALKRVQANLKRHRASALKAACEGRLVPTE
jgi:hypothetical protein